MHNPSVTPPTKESKMRRWPKARRARIRPLKKAKMVRDEPPPLIWEG